MPTLEATPADRPYDVPSMAVVDGIPFPDTRNLVTEDDTPVDNIRSEKQQRLLTETLYTSWTAPDGKPFLALANVGLFYAYYEPPVVPDVMVSLRIPPAKDMDDHNNRSYFTWIAKKPPDLVIEIVSDRRGGEEDRKMQLYAEIGVKFYILFDPMKVYSDVVLRAYKLDGGEYEPTSPALFSKMKLGLRLWEGEYEGQPSTWLRWIDDTGALIPNAKERVDAAEARIRELEQRLKDAGG